MPVGSWGLAARWAPGRDRKCREEGRMWHVAWLLQLDFQASDALLLLHLITHSIALERGLINSQGKTPEATMASSLYTDVKRKLDKSMFTKPVEVRVLPYCSVVGSATTSSAHA